VDGLIEYRGRLIEKLAESEFRFCIACRVVPSGAPIEGDWTVHQVAAHVRDVDRSVYGARVRQALREENPLFENFDADDWMAKNYRKDEPLQGVLDEFRANVDDLSKTLASLPQAAWSRLSRHETMGSGLALQWWVERSLVHIEEHLQAISKIG
jgi:hypothetical protein